MSVIALAFNDSTLYAAGYAENGSVYATTNNGENWFSLNNGLPDSTNFDAIAINGSNLFVGASGRGVYHSSNNGSSWT